MPSLPSLPPLRSLPPLDQLPRAIQSLPRSVAGRTATTVARGADYLGMWMLERRLYGSDYEERPVQYTRVDPAPYRTRTVAELPQCLYPEPPPPRDVQVEPVSQLLDSQDSRSSTLWFAPEAFGGGDAGSLERFDFRFPSQHRSIHPEFRAQLETTPENATVHGRIYRRAGTRPRKAVIVLHLYSNSSLDTMARFVPPELVASHDAEVVMLYLPYHGPRRPAAARFDGEYFFSGDVVRSLEAALQSVSDVRSIVSWLRAERGITRVGLFGGSLGGYVATLTAAVEKRLDFLVALAPPIRISDSRDLPLGRHMRAALQEVEPDCVEDLQLLADPGRFSPALPIERMLFIAGRGDSFCHPHHLQGLQRAWGPIDIRWHRWGHATVLFGYPPGRIFADVEALLRRVGFSD